MRMGSDGTCLSGLAKCGSPVQKYHLADIRGNGETNVCLEFVAQWFVHWHCQSYILSLIPEISQFFLILLAYVS